MGLFFVVCALCSLLNIALMAAPVPILLLVLVSQRFCSFMRIGEERSEIVGGNERA